MSHVFGGRSVTVNQRRVVSPFQGYGVLVGTVTQGNALGSNVVNRPSPERATQSWNGIMGQSLSRVLVHLVFSTKHRTPWVTETLSPELNSYMAGVLRELESPAVIVNTVSDHAHLLFVQSKNHALKLLVERVKTASSKWIKSKVPDLSEFHWQSGYGAFSVSPSNVPAVRRYIETQWEHHRTRTFQDEFREFLKRHGVDYDERYVWD